MSLFDSNKTLRHNSNCRKAFLVMFFFLSLTCLSCRYTPEIIPGGGEGSTDRIGDLPGGRIVSDCNQNSSYNACIYKKNPIAQKGGTVDPSNIASELTSLQTYAVNIQDTTDNLLKNSHYNVTVEAVTSSAIHPIINHVSDTIANMIVYDFSPTLNVTRARLSGGKWTTPYRDDDNFLVEQAVTYYWLMYQQDWMKRNTSQFYASNKNIEAVAVSNTPFNAYWSPLENKIVLGIFCIINSNSNSIACRSETMGMALNAEVLTHEAGHANFAHSASSQNSRGTGRAGCQTHVNCKNKSQSICDVSQEETSNVSRCCLTEKGCLMAIDEGQADFHASILFPNNPSVGEMLVNNLNGITGCFPNSGPLRSPKTNRNATASQIFNSCQASFGGKGEIHVMGILYNSIWWEIYNHAETQPEDILKLFTEHLPLLHYDDHFETAGVKIMNLAKQIFEGSKGSGYADIIREEFSRRGLNLNSESAIIE